MIEHISISGGGPLILNMYGALKQAENKQLLSKTNIKTLHGTSAGSLLCIIYALDYSWDILDNYIINRPWQNVFKFDIFNIYEYYEQNGILDKTVIEELFMPLFNGVNIHKSVTFAEFEQITGKKLYLYTTQFDLFDVAELSVDTTPNISILDAAYASCTLPILFRPQKINDVVYIDGCIFLDNPLAKVMTHNYSPETVMAITKKKRDTAVADITQLNVFDYLVLLLNSLFTKTQMICTDVAPAINIEITSSLSDLSKFFSIASSAVDRQLAIERGINDTNSYLSSMETTMIEEIPQDFPL